VLTNKRHIGVDLEQRVLRGDHHTNTREQLSEGLIELLDLELHRDADVHGRW